jgi:hypothetical protein
MFILIVYSSQKVREGKIVKVEGQFDNVITKLKISGDFSLHPEEILDDIEKSMLDLKRDVSFDTLVVKIQNIIKNYGPDDRNKPGMAGFSYQGNAKKNGEYWALKRMMHISIWLWLKQ